jgi:hypothetical protein
MHTERKGRLFCAAMDDRGVTSEAPSAAAPIDFFKELAYFLRV